MSTKKLLFYLLAVLLGGCLPGLPVVSLHPLFGEKDVVFDEKLLGVWVDDPNSPETTWEFKKLSQNCHLEQSEWFTVPKWAFPRDAPTTFHGDIMIVSNRADVNDNAYRLIFSDKIGKKGMFVAHLVKLKDKLFLDICPAPREQQDPNKIEWAYNYYFLIPGHIFIKINSIEPQLKMLLTDDEKMNEFLKADPNAIKHEFLDDSPILTGLTKELQTFVLKYADSDKVFGKDITLSRKKAAEPNAPAGSKPAESSKEQNK